MGVALGPTIHDTVRYHGIQWDTCGRQAARVLGWNEGGAYKAPQYYGGWGIQRDPWGSQAVSGYEDTHWEG